MLRGTRVTIYKYVGTYNCSPLLSTIEITTKDTIIVLDRNYISREIISWYTMKRAMARNKRVPVNLVEDDRYSIHVGFY